MAASAANAASRLLPHGLSNPFHPTHTNSQSQSEAHKEASADEESTPPSTSTSTSPVASQCTLLTSRLARSEREEVERVGQPVPGVLERMSNSLAQGVENAVQELGRSRRKSGEGEEGEDGEERDGDANEERDGSAGK